MSSVCRLFNMHKHLRLRYDLRVEKQSALVLSWHNTVAMQALASLTSPQAVRRVDGGAHANRLNLRGSPLHNRKYVCCHFPWSPRVVAADRACLHRCGPALR